MAKLSYELTRTFECPWCGHEITDSPTQLQPDAMITCRRCGKATKIESGRTSREKTGNVDEVDPS